MYIHIYIYIYIGPPQRCARRGEHSEAASQEIIEALYRLFHSNIIIVTVSNHNYTIIVWNYE